MSVKPKLLTASVQNVTSSASSTVLFSPNGAASGRLLTNESTATLYIKFDGSAASLTSYSVKVAPGGYYEYPQPLYTGHCNAIWDAANGFARTTEY